MKNGILLIFFSCMFSFAWSQSIEHVNEVTIRNSFDKEAVQAYAVQAQLKVEELVEYLKLLQNSENSDELNEQLKQTIAPLFSEDEAIQLTAIENKKTFNAPSKWIEEWMHSGVKIIALKLINSRLEHSFWMNEYQLIYQKDRKEKDRKINVQIYFKPQSKSFGKKTKTVWDFKLGSVEVVD